MGEDLLLADAPSQIIHGHKRIDFPLSPLNLLAQLGPLTLTKAAADFLRSKFSQQEITGSFADLAIRQYGRELAEIFLLRYSEKLWGLPADRLSPLVSGKRLKGLDLRTFVLETVRGSRAKTRHLDGSFYYPRLGIGMLMERLAAAVGKEYIRTQARVTRIFYEHDRITALEINDTERVPVGRVISTLPLSILTERLDPPPPPEILEQARRLRFRYVKLVVLMLRRERVTPNASLYFPDADLPFTRVYEPKNRSAAMAPPDQTSLVVELPCSAEDEVWTADSAALARRVTHLLEQKRLLRSGDVFDSIVTQIPFAYPVLELGYDDTVRGLLAYFRRFRNLHIAGRSGRFAYTHIQDLLCEGKQLAAELSSVAVN
jgi:protoporphyrinogen oxidase